MERKFVFLINPISGTRGKSSLDQMIRRRMKEAAISFEILPTRQDAHYQFLLDKIRREQITDVVVCGGDGTINQVVNAVRPAPVIIGILPMGSGNGLAFSAGIPPQPSRALDLLFHGVARPVDALLINEEFSCMLCGIGFDAAVAHAFAREKRRGLQTYIKMSAIEFFKASPYPFVIELPEKEIQTDAFFISVANSNQFGNNVTIAPRASLSDGLLDIVIVKKMNKLLLPFSVISQVTGINALQPAREYAPGKNILYLQTPRLIIRNPKEAPLHIDGDPRSTSKVFDISVLKHCFRLWQPV